MPIFTWHALMTHHLRGTYIRLEVDALGVWIGIDTRRPNLKILGPYSELKLAKKRAEVLAQEDKYRVKQDEERI